MTRPYRSFTREIGYVCPLFEAVLLARTSQRSLGLSRAQAAQGIPCAVAMYGVLPRTPLADHFLTTVAWYPAACDAPWTWLRG